MKRISLLLLVLGVFISCHREDSTGEPIKPAEISFSLTSQTSTSNLQVGDLLEVDFEIKDTDTLKASYIIRPETQNAVFHQKLGVDFNLLLEKESQYGGLFVSPYTSVQNIKLSPKELKGKFFIRILKPGNFQHKYILEKYVEGEKEAETSVEYLFNAVKITAYTYSEQIRSPGMFNHSVHRRYWKFIIDDGEERFDKYLTTEESGNKHTYTVNYAGGTYQGDFTAHEQWDFRNPQEQKVTPPKIPSNTIDEIIIRQEQVDKTINNISYRNINVEHK